MVFLNNLHSLKLPVSNEKSVLPCVTWNDPQCFLLELTYRAEQSALNCRAIFCKFDQRTVFQVENSIHYFCAWKTSMNVYDVVGIRK